MCCWSVGCSKVHRHETYERNQNFCFDPASINAMVLSHAHIDHSGNISNFLKHGFAGPIHATPAPVDLCRIMLRDSAYLQERDVHWADKIRSRRNEPLVRRFVEQPYDTPFEVCEGL